MDSIQIRHAVGSLAYEERRVEVDAETASQLSRKFAQYDAETAANARSIQCPLCLESALRENCTELDCDHRFCVACFRSYLDSKISEAQVAEDELICPMPKCGTRITVLQTQGAVYDTPLWSKFLQFRMNMWIPKSGDGFIVTCPSAGCEKFIIDRHRDEVECPHCSKRFCSQCGKDPHKGSSCTENANSDADQRFEQMMVEQGWKPCPVCGMPSERESGCNFMQCRSGTCRKRTYWCYICGLSMARENHYKHYPRGPFDDDCYTPLEHRRIPGRAPCKAAGSRSWGWVTFAVGDAG